MLQNLKNINPKKRKVVFLQTKKKIKRYARDLKDIADLYNLYYLKSGSDASKKGEGLKYIYLFANA